MLGRTLLLAFVLMKSSMVRPRYLAGISLQLILINYSYPRLALLEFLMVTLKVSRKEVGTNLKYFEIKLQDILTLKFYFSCVF